MFQFTHPGKGATKERLYLGVSEKFQFTHPGKGATAIISLSMMMVFCFNSRTLGRVRRKAAKFLGMASEFQFTHPGKGATASPPIAPSKGLFQFTHPGKGATHHGGAGAQKELTFQFTHPGKGATSAHSRSPNTHRVSIHAPWEGCDLAGLSARSSFRRFNSRTLGRVRLIVVSSHGQSSGFNSRTLGRVRHHFGKYLVRDARGFNSRTLGRVRQKPNDKRYKLYHVSIHAPWEGCDISKRREIPYT